MTFDRNFDLYTPGVRRLYHFEFHNELHLLSAEIRRTIDAMAAAAPAKITKGTATRREVEQALALWLAIAEDLEEQDRWRREGAGAAGWSLADRLRELRRANHIEWRAKIAELRREIEVRRLRYPADVDKGLLTRDQAKVQLERLEAIHDLYWRHGYAFDGTHEDLLALGEAVIASNLEQQGIAA